MNAIEIIFQHHLIIVLIVTVFLINIRSPFKEDKRVYDVKIVALSLLHDVKQIFQVSIKMKNTPFMKSITNNNIQGYLF